MVYIKADSQNAKLCNKLLKKNKWIVLYHWNKCGHCLELLPKWNLATKNDKNCCIIEIEYDVYPHLQKKYTNVGGFPSIIVYNNGTIIDEFKEERNLTNLKKFIKSSIYHNDEETKKTIINAINEFENKPIKNLTKITKPKKLVKK